MRRIKALDSMIMPALCNDAIVSEQAGVHVKSVSYDNPGAKLRPVAPITPANEQSSSRQVCHAANQPCAPTSIVPKQPRRPELVPPGNNAIRKTVGVGVTPQPCINYDPFGDIFLAVPTDDDTKARTFFCVSASRLAAVCDLLYDTCALAMEVNDGACPVVPLGGPAEASCVQVFLDFIYDKPVALTPQNALNVHKLVHYLGPRDTSCRLARLARQCIDHCLTDTQATLALMPYVMRAPDRDDWMRVCVSRFHFETMTDEMLACISMPIFKRWVKQAVGHGAHRLICDTLPRWAAMHRSTDCNFAELIAHHQIFECFTSVDWSIFARLRGEHPAYPAWPEDFYTGVCSLNLERATWQDYVTYTRGLRDRAVAAIPTDRSRARMCYREAADVWSYGATSPRFMHFPILQATATEMATRYSRLADALPFDAAVG